MNRRFRLITALGMSVMLLTFVAYVLIKGADVQEPLLQAQELVSKRSIAMSQTVQIDGVAAGPVSGEQGKRFSFYITDRKNKNRILVDYKGAVPDAFRIGRNVIVKGSIKPDAKSGKDVFLAKPGTLVTKCPSKYESDTNQSKNKS